jgi:hypothetical protein
MRCLIAILVALALAGCSGADHSAAERQVADSETGAKGDATESKATVELPGGVKLTARLHLRSEEVNPTSSGALRRRAVYELLDLGPEESFAAIGADFERAGFSPSKRKKRKDGGFTVAFRKDGAESMNVLFYPQIAKNPANAQAKSMIAIGWNVAEPPR